MQAIMLAFACRQQYHVMRAIAASGYKVHVLGQDCARGLEHSRYCASYHTLKFDPLSHSLEDALTEIKQWAVQLSADIILPSDIISTRLLAALAGRLPVPTCALPAPDCFDMLNDKWRFYQFCKSHDVSVPQTWLFDDMEKLKAAAEEGGVPFPFIVKPHDAMGGSGICQIKGKADLKLLDTIKYKPLLVQNLVIGDEIDISVLANRGRIVAYAIQRNLPDKYLFIRHDALLAQAARAVEASGFHGLAHFDAIEEKATGDIYLIECNPRAWMSIFASTVAGLNFVKMSLSPQTLNADNPQFIADKEVGDRGSTLKLIKRIIKERSTNKSDYSLLKYNLMDPVGKKYTYLEEFSDLTLPPASPGSIARQMEALEAIRTKTA